MSFKIEYFDGVPLKGTCKLLDNALKTSTNKTLTFPSAGGTIALTSAIPQQQQQQQEVDLSGIESDISAIQSTVNTISTNVSTLKTSTSTINTNIGTINTNISTINTNVSGARSDISTISSDVSSLSSSASTMSTTLTSMNTTLSSLQTTLNSLSSNFTTALIKACYPVGTVMIRYDSTNPKDLTGFSGTTWSSFTCGLSNGTAWRRTA